MIEETGTSGCESAEEVLVMEVSNLHGDARRRRDTDVTSSGTGKRRRFDYEDQENVFQLQFQSRSDVDVSSHENVVCTAVSGVSDHLVSAFLSSINDDLRADLKAECVSETEIFISSNDGFSKETSTSSVVSLESEEMESLSTSTPRKKKKTATANEATSGRKPSAPPPAMSPSPAELEEFFSEAEKYEQKRFAEKYNFDIVKDVPMEGRYQWVRLKP